MRRFLQRLTGRPSPSDDEIARELRGHLDLDAESLAAAENGAPNDARFAARRRFGNVGGVSESVRDVWHWAWREQLAQDVRHGARAFVRSSAYGLAIVVTLVMSIGSAAAMYSL